jgi:hypothetical protein
MKRNGTMRVSLALSALQKRPIGATTAAHLQVRKNPLRAMKLSLCGAVLLALSSVPSRAAVATLPTAGAAVASSTVAVAAIGGGTTVIVKTSGWSAFFGGVLATGGFALGVVDPPSGTFFSGSFTYVYPSSLLGVDELGWMGSFGANPGLPALPVDPLTWGSGTSVTLQGSNSALTTTVNTTVPGQVSVSFADAAGFAVPGSSPFNFFGVLFEAQHGFQAVDLGTADAPPPGANFYVSTPGFICTPPGSTKMFTCGESSTQYFELRSIPEPSTWAMMLISFFGLGYVGWRRAVKANTLIA